MLCENDCVFFTLSTISQTQEKVQRASPVRSFFCTISAGYSKYSCTDLGSMDSCCMVPMALTMDSAPAMVVV